MEALHKTSPTPRQYSFAQDSYPPKKATMESCSSLLGIAPKLVFLETVSICNAYTVLQKVA